MVTNYIFNYKLNLLYVPPGGGLHRYTVLKIGETSGDVAGKVLEIVAEFD